MPLLPFQNPDTGERREVFVDINSKDPGQFRQQEIDGKAWTRILEVPMMATDTKIDPFSQSDYVRNTGSKKGSLGDLFDYSGEMSAKRADAAGKDPVKDQFYADWAAKHPGQVHQNKKKDDANEALKPYGISIK